MNPYKLRLIMEFVRRHGKLPRDQWGDLIYGDDLLVWYGLNEVLHDEEMAIVKRELGAMAEAEAFMDRWGLRSQEDS